MKKMIAKHLLNKDQKCSEIRKIPQTFKIASKFNKFGYHILKDQNIKKNILLRYSITKVILELNSLLNI